MDNWTLNGFSVFSLPFSDNLRLDAFSTSIILQGCQCAAACATIFREGKTLRCVKTSSMLLLDKNCRKLETWFQAFQEMKMFVQG